MAKVGRKTNKQKEIETLELALEFATSEVDRYIKYLGIITGTFICSLILGLLEQKTLIVALTLAFGMILAITIIKIESLTRLKKDYKLKSGLEYKKLKNRGK